MLAHDMGRHEMNPCGHCGNKEGVKACVCRRAFYCGTRYNIYYIHHMIETLHLVLFIPAKVEELTCPVCFEVASVPIFMCPMAPGKGYNPSPPPQPRDPS